MPPIARIINLVLSLCLLGCMDESKGEILAKAEGLERSEQLLAALGKPDERDKAGAVEQWTYKASDGKVVFTIVAGAIVLELSSKSR